MILNAEAIREVPAPRDKFTALIGWLMAEGAVDSESAKSVAQVPRDICSASSARKYANGESEASRRESVGLRTETRSNGKKGKPATWMWINADKPSDAMFE